MTLGSLFDGIGGFPLAASRYGITPVWASEVEPACISITKRHFPHMIHLGDITQIKGGEIPPADIITFGSPCQDLSVAGNRAGIAGVRSGLFMEAVRIINEMREATHGRYPAWAVWENVPGALSSNAGLDFRTVLESFAGTEIPMPGSGRWAGAGMVRGGRCDIGWRVLDAQHWGVPQRRRRIFLVADFGGQRASEVLFKPESLRRNLTPRQAAGEASAGSAGSGAQASDGTGITNRVTVSGTIAETIHAGRRGGRLLHPTVTGTLCANGTGAGQGNETDLCIVTAGFNGWRSTTGTIEYEEDRAPCIGSTMPPNVMTAADVRAVHQNQCGEVRLGEVANTLNTNANASGRNAPLVMTAGFMAGQGAKAGGLGYQEEVSPTLKASDSGTNTVPSIVAVRTAQTSSNGWGVGDVAYTLDGANPCAVAIDCRNDRVSAVSGTLQAKPNGGQSLNFINPVCVAHGQGGAEINVDCSPTLNCNHEQPYIASGACQVRRLTPVECERLQGFPDNWTAFGDNGKRISDSARYAAIGNSLAIPCVEYIISGIVDVESGAI